jgi:hypothetical protein
LTRGHLAAWRRGGATAQRRIPLEHQPFVSHHASSRHTLIHNRQFEHRGQFVDFHTHVFISYAHADNLEAGGPGWVSRFHELLEPFLTSRLRRTKAVIWRDKRLSDNDVFDPVIMQTLPDSAVMVAVLTDNYVDSNWCQREANAFCEAASRKLGLAPKDKSRVFKVIKLPPERQDTLPPPMRDTLGTRFYVRVDKDNQESQDERDRPLELDPGYGPAYAEKLKRQVALLAQDIADTLKAIDACSNEGQASPNAMALPSKPTVYLAQCGEDRRHDREALRSELVQRGYPVLPDRELPTSEADYRVEVARLLECSALSVHLMGSAPGLVPEGKGLDSVVVIQNEMAVAQTRVGPLRRVVSLPVGTVCERPSHQQFLQAMLTDASLQGGAELISGDLEAVKAAMLASLKRIESPPPSPTTSTASTSEAATTSGQAVASGTVYVIFVEPDRKATALLRKTLGEHFNVLKPVFSTVAGEVREANERSLTDCDSVLIYYGSGTEAWKASVDSELLKARTWRQGRPFRAVYTWVGEPGSDDKADLIDTAGPNVIDGRAGFAPELLTPFLKALDVDKT